MSHLCSFPCRLRSSFLLLVSSSLKFCSNVCFDKPDERSGSCHTLHQTYIARRSFRGSAALPCCARQRFRVFSDTDPDTRVFFFLRLIIKNKRTRLDIFPFLDNRRKLVVFTNSALLFSYIFIQTKNHLNW